MKIRSMTRLLAAAALAAMAGVGCGVVGKPDTADARPSADAPQVVIDASVDAGGSGGADAPLIDAPLPTTIGAFAQAGAFQYARMGHATVVQAGRLWIIGGNICQACLASIPHDVAGTTGHVESAPIEAAGPGTFRSDTNLIAVRNYPRAFAVSRAGHDYIYVLGGTNSTGPSNTDVFPTTIERAEVVAGGLSAFSVVSSTLTVGRAGPAVLVDGDNVYVMGGSTGGATGFVSSIERAVIDAQGGLGPFTPLAGSTLAVDSAYSGLAVDGNNVLLLGGVTDNNVTIATVQQATLTAGALNFTAVPAGTSQLRMPRAGVTTLVVGSRAFVVGGGNGSVAGNPAYADLELATATPLGAFGPFAGMLDQNRMFASAQVISGRYCVTGGATVATTDPSRYLSSIVCAPLQ